MRGAVRFPSATLLPDAVMPNAIGRAKLPAVSRGDQDRLMAGGRGTRLRLPRNPITTLRIERSTRATPDRSAARILGRARAAYSVAWFSEISILLIARGTRSRPASDARRRNQSRDH